MIIYVDALKTTKKATLYSDVMDRLAGRPARGSSPNNPFSTFQEAIDQCKEEEDNILVSMRIRGSKVYLPSM